VTVQKRHTREQENHPTRHPPPPPPQRGRRDDRGAGREEAGRTDVPEQITDLEDGPDDRRGTVLGVHHGARGDPRDGVETAVEGREPERGHPPGPPKPRWRRGEQEPLRHGKQGEDREQDDVQRHPPGCGGRVELRGVHHAETREEKSRHCEEDTALPS